MKLVPRAVFLTRGVGYDRRPYASSEAALHSAGLAPFNLITVPESAIIPPYCQMLSRRAGLEQLEDGQTVFCVLSKNQTDEHRRLLAASIGLAYPRDHKTYGYIARTNSFGETDSRAGDYAEDLAASMLATSLGAKFDADTSYDEEKEIYRISNKIIRSLNITQSALGRDGKWTTVVTAAVFIC